MTSESFFCFTVFKFSCREKKIKDCSFVYKKKQKSNYFVLCVQNNDKATTLSKSSIKPNKEKENRKIYRGNLRQRSEMQMKTVVYMMSSS